MPCFATPWPPLEVTGLCGRQAPGLRLHAAPGKRPGSRIRALGATADSKACSGHRSKAALTLTISRYRVSGYPRLLVFVLFFLLVPTAHHRRPRFSPVSARRRRRSPTQPLRGSNRRVYYFADWFSATAGHWGFARDHHGACGSRIFVPHESPGWNPGCEEAALPPRMGETFSDKFDRPLASLYLATGKTALIHFLVRISRADRCPPRDVASWPSFVSHRRSASLLPDAERAEDQIEDIVRRSRSRNGVERTQRTV